MVLMMASWDRLRFPLALVPLAPESKGHQNLVFRHRLTTCEPPAWVRQVVVHADAGFAANTTLQLIQARHWGDVCAMPRTRQLTHGKDMRDLVCHLPKSCYRRRARGQPAGRRRDDWVLMRPATLNPRGDVTIVLSKKRRNDGPQQVQLFVPNLSEARAGAHAQRIRVALGRRTRHKRVAKRLACGTDANYSGCRSGDTRGGMARLCLLAPGASVWT
jgi:hypothetical protein